MKIGNNQSSIKRTPYFDKLRIIATIAVVTIHCCGKDTLAVGSFDWNVINAYNCLVQWAVPVFVMISGALYLGRDISFQKLFRKSILRIGTVFLFWSVLYALWRCFVTHEKHGAKAVLLTVIKGNFHMWFLFMIAGLYLIVPILNKIVESKKIAGYFVILSFLFSFLFPQMINVIGLKSTMLSNLANDFISKFHVELVLGYSGYFVLGYLINQTLIGKKTEYIIYALGLCSTAATVFGTVWLSSTNRPATVFSDELTVNILLTSAAVFVFAKQHLNKPVKNDRSASALVFASKCTLGIYMVHPLILDSLKRFAGITNLTFNPLVCVPMLVMSVFVLSFAVSAVINRIPLLGKWIV